VTVFSAKPLTIGAAYLYQQFATGLLLDYNFTDSPAGSRTGNNNAPHGTAFELQRALSYFMGEYSFDQYNIYMNGVVPLPVNPHGAYTGTQVSLLNLWAPGQPHDPAHAYQDLFVLTSVPEPSTFALASLGAAALLALRRKGCLHPRFSGGLHPLSKLRSWGVFGRFASTNGRNHLQQIHWMKCSMRLGLPSIEP